MFDGIFFLEKKEMEEREKLVRHMWDVYTSHGRRIGLAKFWEDAFKSAYEDMTSEVPGVQEAAVSEIAKMSLRSIRLESPPSSNSMVSSVALLDYLALSLILVLLLFFLVIECYWFDAYFLKLDEFYTEKL